MTDRTITLTLTEADFGAITFALLMHAGECLTNAMDETKPQVERDRERRNYERSGALYDRLTATPAPAAAA